MSSELLGKLTIKPIPKTKEDLVIKIKKPASEMSQVVVKTKIVDKSQDNLDFNRDEFLAKIKPKTDISAKSKTIIKTKSIQDKEDREDREDKDTIIMQDVEKLPERLILQPFTDKSTDSQKITDISESTKSKSKDTVKPSARITQTPIGIPLEGPSSQLIIGSESIDKRLPQPKEKILIRASNYYMNNREIFINFINSIFGDYKKLIDQDEKSLSCEKSKTDEFSLLTHQKIVRDYINLYTPYRGLLLYHGLGSGKTCSSIGIAEGLKTDKKIIIMTPASLRVNYMEELKKCGDLLYKKNQYWEFIDTIGNDKLSKDLAFVLSIPFEYIKKKGGAWLVNVSKKSNYETLETKQRITLDEQINEMIKSKYKFINYNGLRNSHLQNMTQNFTVNPFDNCVVIVDEAHNLVSRIVNKLKNKSALSMKLYEYLMTAENAKIVLLTGTPIINYPNEVSILFNILRGKIKTYKFKLVINSEKKLNQEILNKLFLKYEKVNKLMDYIDYQPSSNTLVVTQNPFGFVSQFEKTRYEGVHLDTDLLDSNLTQKEFVTLIAKVLKKQDINISPGGVEVNQYKALPDTLEEFKKYFIDDKNQVKNENLFKRRILGLTSYFPDIDALLPIYTKSSNFHIVKMEMSDFQFKIYEEARVQERKLELQNSKKKKKGGDNIYDDAVSTYRIFSRAFCNFVFPRPTITRPFPNEGATLESAITDNIGNEDELDAITKEQQALESEAIIELEEAESESKPELEKFDKSYEGRIKSALAKLNDKKEEFLTPEALKIYSPKFLNVLENVNDPTFKGLHLIYSQFRTLEGIGILKLILEANNFTEFKLKKNPNGLFTIDISPENRGKPTFALYTGTESAEIKEITRNIFNSDWQFVPSNIVEELKSISSNNFLGEIIKVFMITASGAEGISLQNVRYVHLIEPYWHPVRLEQVIGRARRICSHKNLPKQLQTVDVFLYLMVFSQQQMESDDHKELRLKDKSKLDNKTPLTSDQALFEISNIKENINKSILKSVKEASIDCILHLKEDNKENLKCFSFGSPSPEKLSYLPSIDQEEDDEITKGNKAEEEIDAVKVKLHGINYAWEKSSGKLYDYRSYKVKNPIQVGTLQITGEKYKLELL